MAHSENIRVARNWHGKSLETTLAKDLTDGIVNSLDILTQTRVIISNEKLHLSDPWLL